MVPLDAVVGLGNPGSKYSHTYHNVGFLALDRLISTYDHDSPLDHDGDLYPVNDGPASYLGKPGLYVNRSGEVVKQWVDEYDLVPESLLIVYDDFSLDVGQLRVRPSGSPGGHNGMKDIINRLGTKEIPRVRIGIGPVSPGGDPAEFVLSKITDNDRKIFRDIFTQFPTLVEEVAEDGINTAMNQWNGVVFNG